MKTLGSIETKEYRDVKMNTPDIYEDDFSFKLWKSKLNKELLSFWESMQETYEK
ncbi:MAG: hypothetical protein KAI20_04420 [Thermoplasmatales archaeon]|nr:hypothetical protein [Thermoplasmatales archaeon]